MARKVWLTITGIQKGFDQEEPVTLVTEGSYIYKNDVHTFFIQNGQKKGRLLKTASLFHLAAWNFVKQVQAILIPFLYLIRSIIKTVFISHRQDRWNWYLTQRRFGCCMEMHILNYS